MPRASKEAEERLQELGWTRHPGNRWINHRRDGSEVTLQLRQVGDKWGAEATVRGDLETFTDSLGQYPSFAEAEKNLAVYAWNNRSEF